MLSRRVLPSLMSAAAAVLVVGALGPTRLARSADVAIVSNAFLEGTIGGSFASHTAPLAACTEYTIRLNYAMQVGGTPVENGIGVEVWNNNGSAQLTSSPFGERIWYGPGQKYYLRSFRRADDPSIEEVRFQVPCSDTNPSYSFRVFNYLPGNTLNYTLSLPGGQEG